MAAEIIGAIIIALGAGFIGSRIERKRSSTITKREATELRRDIVRLYDHHIAIGKRFDEHIEIHKQIKFEVETLASEFYAVTAAAGFKIVRRIDA